MGTWVKLLADIEWLVDTVLYIVQGMEQKQMNKRLHQTKSLLRSSACSYV